MRTEIKIETQEFTVIRIARTGSSFFKCAACNSDALHMSVAKVADILQVEESVIFGRAARGEVHSSGLTNGELLICANSALGSPK